MNIYYSGEVKNVIFFVFLFKKLLYQISSKSPFVEDITKNNLVSFFRTLYIFIATSFCNHGHDASRRLTKTSNQVES